MEEPSRPEDASSSSSSLAYDSPRAQQKAHNGDSSPLLTSSGRPPEKDATNDHSNGTKALGNPWLPEWCALMCCVSSFASLIIMLARFDDKLLSEWKWTAVSINTVTSILAAISKTTLAMAISSCLAQFKWNWFREKEGPLIDFDRFDNASKGAWGSFRLMKSIIHRPHWVVLGAMATIILPTYDPFLQALINLENITFVKAGTNGWAPLSNTEAKNQLETSSSASIGRCLDLNGGSYIKKIGSPQTRIPFNGSDGKEMMMTLSPYDLRTDFGMTAAIWNGLSGLIRPTNLRPNYVCSSGNCTWDVYTSLAVCSKCNDLSEDLVKVSGNTKFVGSLTYSGSHLYIGPNSTFPEITYQWPLGFRGGPNDKFTKYSLKNSDLNISNYDGPRECYPADQFCPDTYMTAKVTTNPGLTLTFQDLESLIISVQIIKADDSWKMNKTLWQNTTVMAQECSLSFCVGAYDSKVSSGKIEESVQTWAKRSPNSFAATDAVLDTDVAYTKYENYSLDLPGNVRTDLQMYIPSEAIPEFKGQRKFNISQSTIAGMIQVFSGGFETSSDSSETISDFSETNSTFPPIIYPAVGWITPPSFVESVGNSSDINTTFENLASSLSIWMRDQAPDSSTAKGYATQTMVVIRIQWPYLIVPAITILAGLFVVLMSITDTKRRRLPVWKGDSLVLLGHGIEDNLYNRVHAAATRNELYQTARDEPVLFKEDYGQWKLGRSKKSGDV